MVYVCLVVVGKVKYVFLAGSIIVDAFCCYLAYAHPSMLTEHMEETAYIDSIISLMIIAVLICGMILFQKWYLLAAPD